MILYEIIGRSCRLYPPRNTRSAQELPTVARGRCFRAVGKPGVVDRSYRAGRCSLVLNTVPGVLADVEGVGTAGRGFLVTNGVADVVGVVRRCGLVYCCCVIVSPFG